MKLKRKAIRGSSRSSCYLQSHTIIWTPPNMNKGAERAGLIFYAFEKSNHFYFYIKCMMKFLWVSWILLVNVSQSIWVHKKIILLCYCGFVYIQYFRFWFFFHSKSKYLCFTLNFVRTTAYYTHSTWPMNILSCVTISRNIYDLTH